MSGISSIPIGSKRRPSSQFVSEEMESTEPVYTDNCLVCNQHCVLNNSGMHDGRTRSAVNPGLEVRQVLYKAFEIGVDPVDVVNAEDEFGSTVPDLPLCSTCTFNLGQLKSVQSQLEILDKEYRKMIRTIAFSIVDVVASNSEAGFGMSLDDFNSQPSQVMVAKMREFEVETIQQLIFEKWHEASYDDDELLVQEHFMPIVDIQEPVEPAIPNRKPSSAKPKHYEAESTRNGPVPVPSTSAKMNSNGTTTTTVISITTNDSRNLKRGSRRGIDGANAITNQIYQQINAQNDPLEVDLEEEEHARDESGLESYEQEEGLAETGQLDPGNASTATGAETTQGYPSPGFELTEWSGSSDESQERTMEYDGEADDDTLLEFGLSLNSESRTPVRRRRGTSDSDAGLVNIDYHQNEDGHFVCTFCGKTFIHKYPYRDHVKTHTGEGPKCPICSKIFPKRHNLMLHLRTHTGEKPYSCSVCNKGFADKSNLKVHMRVHTGERPYKCEYCDQAFVNSSRLVVHRRSHSGEKPHQCNLCSKAFSTSNQLNSHRKVHFDAKKPFPCSECGKGFSNNTTLTAHMGSFHGHTRR